MELFSFKMFAFFKFHPATWSNLWRDLFKYCPPKRTSPKKFSFIIYPLNRLHFSAILIFFIANRKAVERIYLICAWNWMRRKPIVACRQLVEPTIGRQDRVPYPVPRYSLSHIIYTIAYRVYLLIGTKADNESIPGQNNKPL